MPGIDILLVTYVNDFVWAEYCVKSLKKYAKGFRIVILVTDDDGNTVPDSLTNIMPINVVHVKQPSTFPPNLQHRTGYLWQQYLKLNWMEYTDADAILVIDSDEMLTKELTPSDFRDAHGRWRWFYRNWEFADAANVWKTPTEDVLRFEPEYEAMCCSLFIFERNMTYRFIEYLRAIHGASSLWDVFFKYDLKLFSEFNTYGSFVNKFDNEKVYYKVVNNTNPKMYCNSNVHRSWSYGGLHEEDKKQRDLILQDLL